MPARCAALRAACSFREKLTRVVPNLKPRSRQLPSNKKVQSPRDNNGLREFNGKPVVTVLLWLVVPPIILLYVTGEKLKRFLYEHSILQRTKVCPLEFDILLIGTISRDVFLSLTSARGTKAHADGRSNSATFDWRSWYRTGFPFFHGNKTEINAQNPSSWILTGGGFSPQPYPSRICCHSGSSPKCPFVTTCNFSASCPKKKSQTEKATSGCPKKCYNQIENSGQINEPIAITDEAGPNGTMTSSGRKSAVIIIVTSNELLTQQQNGVIATGGEKEWGQSQAVPTNPEHAAKSDLNSERGVQSENARAAHSTILIHGLSVVGRRGPSIPTLSLRRLRLLQFDAAESSGLDSDNEDIVRLCPRRCANEASDFEVSDTELNYADVHTPRKNITWTYADRIQPTGEKLGSLSYPIASKTKKAICNKKVYKFAMNTESDPRPDINVTVVKWYLTKSASKSSTLK
ncbi:hypothetical protein J6590_029410 [Homalodisca vitripennis]|nr:hypothetical protein J6590_029410 [Homalodisca vitripennis]